jgi:hypothetical protein
MMFGARQAIGVAIAAAVLATSVSACGGSPQSAAGKTKAAARPVGNPLKGLTSYQIIKQAFANTRASTSVQITGKVFSSGQTTRLSSLTIVNGSSGCVGDIYRSRVGGFQFLYDGTTAWILPTSDYWQTAGNGHPTAVGKLEGKYLQLTPGDASTSGSHGAHGTLANLGALVRLCSLQTLVGTGPSPARRTGIGDPTATVVGGVPALKMLDTADGGYLTVSNTSKPRLLSFFVPGRYGASFSIRYFSTPVTVGAPAPANVVDGAQYGL